MEKSALRKKYKQLRSGLSSEEVEDFSLQIANRCLDLAIWDKNYYHIFLPIKDKKEVNTEYLLHILQGKDKSIVISRADFSNLAMTHVLLQENTSITVSPYGIPEPQAGLEVPASILEVIFIPLLAFDLKGNRIGYGKGFYDRFLEQCSDSSVKIGLSFFEAEPNISNETTDIPLDFCITPKKIYGFKNSDLYL